MYTDIALECLYIITELIQNGLNWMKFIKAIFRGNFCIKIMFMVLTACMHAVLAIYNMKAIIMLAICILLHKLEHKLCD